jgi:hypothetical protein
MVPVLGESMAALLVEQMPRTGRPKRDDKAVKIARDLAVRAKMIADTQGITIAEYLSGLLRPLIERDFPRAMKRLDQGSQEQS